MKYVVRRVLGSVIFTPLIAVAWVMFYALLIGIGGEPTATIGEVFVTGLWLGGFVSAVLVLDAWGKVGK